MRKLLTVVFMLSISTSSWATCSENEKADKKPASKSAALASALKTQNNSSSATALHFKVDKISCMSCAAKIKKALKTELFVQDVEVDVKEKVVSFECPLASCSPEKVQSILSNIGYDAVKI